MKWCLIYAVVLKSVTKQRKGHFVCARVTALKRSQNRAKCLFLRTCVFPKFCLFTEEHRAFIGMSEEAVFVFFNLLLEGPEHARMHTHTEPEEQIRGAVFKERSADRQWFIVGYQSVCFTILGPRHALTEHGDPTVHLMLWMPPQTLASSHKNESTKERGWTGKAKQYVFHA